jgi:hypothetical protein
MMFDGHKRIELEMADSELTLEQLIDHLKRNHLRDKEEMFV